MPTSEHTRKDGLSLSFAGERLYEVTIRVADGQTATVEVAADDEGKAKTRAMAAQDSLSLRGQVVEYDVRDATDDPFAYDLISGDWLYDADRDGLSRVYEGVVTDSWSGGVEFVASRKVVEEIVRDQERFVADQAQAYPDNADGIPRLWWDGATLVQTFQDEEFRYEPVDPDGNYEVGFGWIWEVVEQDDRFFEVVRNDGTVEQNELQEEETC